MDNVTWLLLILFGSFFALCIAAAVIDHLETRSRTFLGMEFPDPADGKWKAADCHGFQPEFLFYNNPKTGIEIRQGYLYLDGRMVVRGTEGNDENDAAGDFHREKRYVQDVLKHYDARLVRDRLRIS